MLSNDFYTRPRATDPSILIQELPVDAAGFRSLRESLENLEDEVGPHLDTFSSTASSTSSDIDRDALIDLFRRRRRELELAVLVCSTRLRAIPVRSIYVGGLLANLCDDALGRCKSKSLARLFTRIQLKDPGRWGRVVASFEALAQASNRWREWPPPELAREAIEALTAIGQPWNTAVSEVRRELSGGVNRERRRDPAFRRAVAWHQLAVSLLRPLTLPGGPLRLIIDYCFAVIAYFEAAVVNAPRTGVVNRAASDLLILEVFGMLEQYSLASDNLEDDAPHFLEQGETNRRKRIQRARLQVLLHWELLIDDLTWLEWVYPALDRLTRGPEQPVIPASEESRPRTDTTSTSIEAELAPSEAVSQASPPPPHFASLRAAQPCHPGDAVSQVSPPSPPAAQRRAAQPCHPEDATSQASPPPSPFASLRAAEACHGGDAVSSTSEPNTSHGDPHVSR